MDKSQKDEVNEPIEQEEVEGLYSETLLRDIVTSYQEAWNRNNDKYEIKYYLTLTTHKIPTKDGNKDVAYLRLERAIRPLVKDLEEPTSQEPEWQTQLVHTESYTFRNMQERVNPNQRWKDFLFQSCIARLVGAGLEYAELLQRMKQTSMEEAPKKEENKLDLVITDQMPAPLTEDDIKYKNYIKEQREKEGIK